MPQKKLRALEQMHMEWEMSRKKQAVPNDPIQVAKQKMLERKVRRQKLLEPAPDAPPTFEVPLSTTECKPGCIDHPHPPSSLPLPVEAREYWEEVERLAPGLVTYAPRARRASLAPPPAEHLKEMTKKEVRQRALSKKMHRGIAVLEQLPSCLKYREDQGLPAPTRMIFSRPLEAGLNEIIRRNGGIPSRRPLPGNDFCGEYLGIAFSMEESTGFFVRLFSGKDEVSSVLEPASGGLVPPFRIPPSSTPSAPIPDPDPLPLVIRTADRKLTPKDALGPKPGIIREKVLGTEEWPRHINIQKEWLKHHERAVRYHWEPGRLYFWLANGSAVYDVAEHSAGTWLEGDLLCGMVFPLLDTPPVTPVGSTWNFPTISEEE
jgi:hypothetical protein